jgi:hypothetical protein
MGDEEPGDTAEGLRRRILWIGRRPDLKARFEIDYLERVGDEIPGEEPYDYIVMPATEEHSPDAPEPEDMRNILEKVRDHSPDASLYVLSDQGAVNDAHMVSLDTEDQLRNLYSALHQLFGDDAEYTVGDLEEDDEGEELEEEEVELDEGSLTIDDLAETAEQLLQPAPGSATATEESPSPITLPEEVYIGSEREDDEGLDEPTQEFMIKLDEEAQRDEQSGAHDIVSLMEKVMARQKAATSKRIATVLGGPLYPYFGDLEAHVNRILEPHGLETHDDLDEFIEDPGSPELKMAALCKKGIMLSRADKAAEAYDMFTAAEECYEGPNDTIPTLLVHAIATAILPKTDETVLASDDSALEEHLFYAPEFVAELERRREELNLDSPIAPARGRISIVRRRRDDTDIDPLEGEPSRPMNYLVRREQDPDEIVPEGELSSVEKEAEMLRYFHRLREYLSTGRHLAIVPKLRAVVEARPGIKASYRDFVPGIRVLDQVRELTKQLEHGNLSGEKAEKVKFDLRSLLMNTVRQCAYVLACGPMGLVKEPSSNVFDHYYERRMDSRVLDGLDDLCIRSDIDRVSRDNRSHLYNSMPPIHAHLSRQQAGFYKDCWLGNSIVKATGKDKLNMYFFDLVGAMQLPIVIDLATVTCYGKFVSSSVQARRPGSESDWKYTFEWKMVDTFLRTYCATVPKFNEIVAGAQADPLGYILEAIEDDVHPDKKRLPERYKPPLTEFLERVASRPLGAETMEEAFREIRRADAELRTNLHPEYLRDLEAFFCNLEHKDTFEIPDAEKNPKDYREALTKFWISYNAALAHRGLVLAGTFAKFVARYELDPGKRQLLEDDPAALEKARQDISRKRYLLLDEIPGTLGNAQRAINIYAHASEAYSHWLKPDELLSRDQQTKMISFLQTVRGKIVSINTNNKLGPRY